MGNVRAASLRGFTELVTELGGDPHALLSRYSLQETIDDEEALVPVHKVVRLLEDAAKNLRCPDFGLRLAQHQDLGVLGPVAIAIENARTVGEAIQVASSYLFVHQQGASITPLLGEPGQVEICYEFGEATSPHARQAYDLTLAGGHRSMQMLGGARYKLLSVLMPHDPVAPAATYQRFFGAPVLFRQPRPALVVSRAFLRAALPKASEPLRGMATSYLEAHYGTRRASMSSLVRMAITRGLERTETALADVAAAVALHPRTLQRRLTEEGAAFDDLREQVLREEALRLLQHGEIPLTEVATRLGLSQQSALTRSCKRWFGEAPRAIRQRLAKD